MIKAILVVISIITTFMVIAIVMHKTGEDLKKINHPLYQDYHHITLIVITSYR